MMRGKLQSKGEWEMKKHLMAWSIISVLLVLAFQVNDYISIGILNKPFVTSIVFLSIFGISIWAVVGVFKKIFAPILIIVVGISVIVVAAHVFEVELNYYAFEEERQEMIEKLVSGEIKKEDRNQSGFAFYFSPSEYSKSNRQDYIDARIYSPEKHFVFFQSAKSRMFDFVGLTEGFIYSSTGEYPTRQEFDNSFHYRKINDNWYFVSSDEKRFMNSCYFLCGEPLERP